MKKISVVVIDDSAFSRRTITEMLENIQDIEVIGYASNGEEGMQKVIALKPDLVTLDLEMPKMDGFTLLRILTRRFSIPVIVISALNKADKVFKALELGALDFVAKPTSSASSAFSHPVEIVAIGSSTGGPPALQNIFSSFQKGYPFAVVVAQHMPPGFTKAFAERLDDTMQFDVKEAEDGDAVVPGKILIAPGGMNMVFEIHRGQVTARIVPPSPTDRYLPSVDALLESCAPIYKNRMVGVILTGMGNDGSRGVQEVKKHGGYLIAESEESAVVYGMPREAVATGVMDQIVPLHEIANEILVRGKFI